jgi:hypothetical protein
MTVLGQLAPVLFLAAFAAVVICSVRLTGRAVERARQAEQQARIAAAAARRATAGHKHPAPGATDPNPAQPQAPGLHPHNPFHPGFITYAKPCGCWRTIDATTKQETGRHVCAQAKTWARWESELR